MRSCACAIILKGERLLLGKRASHRKVYANKWDLIGGAIDDGEGPEEALVRELGEEVGLTPVEPEYLSSVLDISFEVLEPAIYHIFAVRTWTGGQPIMANDEHSALAWFSVAEACAIPDLALDDYRPVFRMIRF